MSSSGPIDWTPMIIGFAAGLMSRLLALRPGSSHYPGFPSGWLSQFALGIIASMVGSSIIVALAGKEFTAATFLTLAATQFRDVRNTERQSLEHEEKLILVPRGTGYIEGLALTYEARNYSAMLVALITSAAATWLHPVGGVVIGLAALYTGERMMSGPRVGDLMEIKPAKISFQKGSLLYAGDVMLMEVGLEHARQRWLEYGVGVEIVPKDPRGEAALWSVSQRQAITHQVVSAVGVQKDVGYPDQTPLCRMEMPEATGRAALGILPVQNDIDELIRGIQRTPILESGKWSKVHTPRKRQDPSFSSSSGTSNKS